MQVRFLLGPAGSGKTFRCLSEIRDRLSGAPEGVPVVLVAPKQTTYELERQLLSETSTQGYTRLQVLSFERLAVFVFEQLGAALPELLGDEGRVMVLRSLLARKRQGLRLFRASARLTGFAQQLSSAIAEFQQSRLTPELLRQLAGRMAQGTLSLKLQDLAELMEEYLDWLGAHGLQDRERLLEAATAALNERPAAQRGNPGLPAPRRTSHLLELYLYIDGFAEFSETEIELVAALLPCCVEATVTFCLPELLGQGDSWLSGWSVARQALERCTKRLAAVPAAEISYQHLPRDPQKSRFGKSGVLRHLERHWMEGEGADRDEHTPREPGLQTSPSYEAGVQVPPCPSPQSAFAKASSDRGEGNLPAPGPRWVQGCNVQTFVGEKSQRAMVAGTEATSQSLRVIQCTDPEAEVIFAAREIRAFVRRGGRYRESAVLVRDLETYHHIFQRIFSRYEIPFFLDRRQSMGHHPLAELTRSALRTVALGWQHDDWFAVLKTGLIPAGEQEIDELENEALARGWQGSSWERPLRIQEAGRTEQDKQRLLRLEADLERLRRRLIPPLQGLALALRQANNKPTGVQLAAAIRNLWMELKAAEQLEEWASMCPAAAGFELGGAHHATVWNEINGWVENIEFAFSNDALPIREWLPILEAGLANLTVGLIPPALDLVLIGTVDRSRNPDIRLGLVLGMNETVFPASPATAVLLTPTDRTELERHGVMLGLNVRQQLNRERYYAYIACTRPREQLLLTFAEGDAEGAVLNPSPFLLKIRQLFPALEVELASSRVDWRQCEHPHELFRALFRHREAAARSDGIHEGEDDGSPAPPLMALSSVPEFASRLHSLFAFRNPAADEPLSPYLAEQLYGPVLRTSVSRMEQFAACPFKYFIHSGMRAEERKLFELDVKEQGTFQHDVLALFHEQLQREHKRWRDITPAEARVRIAAVAAALAAGYREGLLQANEQTRFMARSMTESLQDFVEILVEWMRRQYAFDPVRVELAFGETEAQPAWTVALGEGHELQVYGRIDRVDLCRRPGEEEALCVVVDYKSSQKQLDPLLLAHGLQLQLLTYLNVLRDWPHPEAVFGASRLTPAGVFYVNLSGRYGTGKNRMDALGDAEADRRLAYRHTGRFDIEALPYLDSRPGPGKGDQFNFQVLKDGRMHQRCRDPLATDEFIGLLDSIKRHLADIGQRIYSGAAALDPYRKGSSTACDQCAYQWICRVDPWTQRYRLLRAGPGDQERTATS